MRLLALWPLVCWLAGYPNPGLTLAPTADPPTQDESYGCGSCGCWVPSTNIHRWGELPQPHPDPWTPGRRGEWGGAHIGEHSQAEGGSLRLILSASGTVSLLKVQWGTGSPAGRSCTWQGRESCPAPLHRLGSVAPHQGSPHLSLFSPDCCPSETEREWLGAFTGSSEQIPRPLPPADKVTRATRKKRSLTPGGEPAPG